MQKYLAAVLAVALSGVAITGTPAFAAKKTAAGKTVTLEISTQGDQLLFDKKTLSAPAGATVKLTLNNTANVSSGLQHNWVLVKPGAADQVASAGIVAGPAKNYVPDSADVLASTKLVPPDLTKPQEGRSTTIMFTAPTAPGDYPFLCTFPGHGVTMRGTLKVK